MPSLIQLLRSQDLGYARIVAGLWGLEHPPNDLDAEVEATAAAMLNESLTAEVVETLDARAREALMALARAAGRLPWNAFVREFGEVREMGAGRRDRELPHLRPASAAEALYYRALMGRAFFETDGGLLEFAYVPDEVLGNLPRPQAHIEPASQPGRAATPAEHKHMGIADDAILDEATVLLAALRAGSPAETDPVLRGLLHCAGVLIDGAPDAARAKAFLEAPRSEALRMLIDGWKGCTSFDELRLMPGLRCEGPWTNQPHATRAFVLAHVEAVPGGTWWNLNSFVESIKRERPDFQRPAGDFDSWFVKRLEDGSYLRGFEAWDEVDGSLLRFMVTTVMHRLALTDIGTATATGAAQAFRRSARRGGAKTEEGRLSIGSQGRISAGRDVPRAARYQLARFCEWDVPKAGEYRYRVTPASLARAKDQRLTVDHLLTLLARHADGGIPPSFVRALKRWATNGTEATAETQLVLKVQTPEMLRQLRASKAARYLGEPLGPTTVIVKRGALRKVEEAMTELGVLLDDHSGAST